MNKIYIQCKDSFGHVGSFLKDDNDVQVTPTFKSLDKLYTYCKNNKINYKEGVKNEKN